MGFRSHNVIESILIATMKGGCSEGRVWCILLLWGCGFGAEGLRLSMGSFSFMRYG